MKKLNLNVQTLSIEDQKSIDGGGKFDNLWDKTKGILEDWLFGDKKL